MSGFGDCPVGTDHHPDAPWNETLYNDYSIRCPDCGMDDNFLAHVKEYKWELKKHVKVEVHICRICWNKFKI